MKNFFALLLMSSAFVFPLAAASAEDVKKEAYHCEKKDKDGEITDIDATSKDDCKKKGGMWKKGHDGSHDHKEGDDHKHE